MYKKIFKTPEDSNYFFGYYDKSPFCINDNKHLSLKVDFLDRLPVWGDVADIGFFDLNDSEAGFQKISETNIFNWQQANMLQWFGDKHTKIAFNNLERNKFNSVILDLHTGNKSIFDIALYDISNDSSYALCIDHERHHWVRRAYSYDGISNIKKKGNQIKDDGIYKLCFINEKISKIIDIADLLNIKPLKSMTQASHYVEHIMISPNNKRFAFLHRWKAASGDIYSRLYTCNHDGSNLYLLNDSGRMSHFCWINDAQIFGWGGSINSFSSLKQSGLISHPFLSPFKSLYKKLVHSNAVDGHNSLSSMVTGDSYIIFNDLSKNFEKISVKIINKDGHPSYNHNNENLVLTDTYPDKNSKASIFLYNIKNKDVTILDTLNSLPHTDNTEFRCDLHPKWSFSGKYISIDTLDCGSRGIYVYEKTSL